MNQVSSEKIFSIATLLLGIWLFAKIFWVIIEYLAPLPTQGISVENTQIKSSLDYRYKFVANKKQVEVVRKPQPAAVIKKRLSLDYYKMVGIYTDDTDVLVTLTKGQKSTILSKGDKIEGYTLIGGKGDTAYFKKDGKKYTMKIAKDSNIKGKTSGNTKKTITQDVKKIKDKKEAPNEAQKIKNSEQSGNRSIGTAGTMKSSPQAEQGTVAISRDDINKYIENPRKLSSDIGFRAVSKDGVLIGYKVRFVRNSSPIGKSGLKRGDIIKAVNGEDITNPATAMSLLKGIENMDRAIIKITRGNQEKELEYEIK